MRSFCKVLAALFTVAAAIAILFAFGDDVPGEPPLPMWWSLLCMAIAIVCALLAWLCKRLGSRHPQPMEHFDLSRLDSASVRQRN